MRDDGNERDEVSSRSVRMLLILEEVARLGIPATPTEINRSIGLPKQTLHRLFASLEALQFLQREHDGRSFSPGPRMRSMAYGVISSSPVRAARLAIMTRVAEKIGETCNLAVPERDAMIYLDRVETKWPLRIQFPIGSRVPFHCTASGKLYLSTLSKPRLERVVASLTLERMATGTITQPAALIEEIGRIRSRGFSEDREEFIDAMVALAVPILDGTGRMVSALAIHAPTLRMSLEQAHGHLDTLRDGAADLSALLVETA